jgi:hypothetical protein
MMETANALLSFVVITFMFAVIYKLLPDVKVAWRNVWTGAAVTAVLFTIGKTLIGLYLERSTVASVYGAAGSPHRHAALRLLFGAGCILRRRVHEDLRETLRSLIGRPGVATPPNVPSVQ